MKKLVFILLLILSITIHAQTAKIKIDVNRIVGEIDPKIYGVFMEPIHFNGKRMGLPDTVDFNTLYGNLYDPSSPLADKNGFRKDYIDAMKELKITNMRWPGGNFVMGYNWQDGIGPKEKRPARINLAWGGIDNNHVGTDEWMQLNKAIGCENVVCVNLGLSTIMDACYWVEYCNFKKGTYYSDLRAKNGHPEPYNVKIWDLGNEVDGAPWELGYKNAEDYVKIGREAAKAMKAVDNSIKLVASGSSYYENSGQWIDWNRKVLAGLGDMIDYISIHRYWENSKDYYTYMGESAMDFEEKIKIPAAEIEAVKAMKNFKNLLKKFVQDFANDQRGLALVMVAAGMVALVGFTALVSDIGLLVVKRQQLVNTMDAVAMAGAQALPDETNATTVAEDYARFNNFDPDDPSYPLNVSFTGTGNGKIITVSGKKNVNMIFAKVLGISSEIVTASASAQKQALTSYLGVIPLTVKDTTVASLSNGQEFDLKTDDPLVGPGNFGPISIGSDTDYNATDPGASAYRYNLTHGTSQTITVGDSLPTKPGNMKGPTGQGMGDRINGTLSYYPNYAADDPRVVVIPVYQDVPYVLNGRTSVTVSGFASLYITEVNGANVKAIFIKKVKEGVSSPSQTNYGVQKPTLIK